MHVAQIVWVRKMTKTSGLSAANEDRIQPYLTKARAHNLEMVRRLLKMSLGARLSGDVKPYSRNKLGEIMGVQPERTSWISQVSRADLRVQNNTYNLTYDGIPDMVLNIALFVLPCSVFGSR